METNKDIKKFALPEENGLIKLSVSSTKTYESCPKKYYFSYIEKLPKKSWAHLTLGTFCHAVLEQFHKTWIQDKNKVLVDLMGQSFADQRPNYISMTPDQLEEAKIMLQEYLFIAEREGMPNTLSVEEPFKISVGKYMLRGFMDRIDVDPDGVFNIIDYKTTSKTGVKYLDDFQLLVYGMALKHKYPDMEKFRGTYVLLKLGSKLITNEYSVADIYKCEKKILDFGNRIEHDTVWEKRPSALCNYCDFYNVCMGNWIDVV